MARRPSGGDGLGHWNPMSDHHQSSNVYRRHQTRDSNDGDNGGDLDRRLYIGNIPSGIVADGLKNLLSESGKIVEISIIPDKNKPDNQFGFIKTETKADALRIIDHFDGYKISGNRALRINLQRPRRKPDEEREKVPERRSGNTGSSDSDSPAVNNFVTEGGTKPVGRSQRLMAAALGQEPPVGVSRSAAGVANGYGNHVGHGFTSPEDSDPLKQLKNRLQDTRKPSDENLPKPSPVLPSRPLSQAVVQKSGGPAATNSATGPCAKCGRIGDKHCLICKQVYCSRDCQREDWPYHKKVCVEKNIDALEVDEEFEKRFSVNFSPEFLQKQTEIVQETLQLQKTVIPLNTTVKVVCIVAPFSPSEIYIFLESQKQKLVDLGAELCEHYNVVENQRHPKVPPAVGDLCASQFSADQLWYRAEVEAVHAQTAIVRYVDYGNKEAISLPSICEIADRFKSVPYLAVQCSLVDIEPTGLGVGTGGSDSWSTEAVKFIQDLVPSCALLDMTAVCYKNNAYHIELLLPDGTDVAKKLVDAGFAKYSKKVAPASPLTQNSPAQRAPSIKQDAECVGILSAYGWPSDLSRLKGQRMTVEFVEFISPDELWIQFDPLPGQKIPPPMRLSVADVVSSAALDSNASPATNEVVVAPKVHRCTLPDLPKLELQNEVKVEVTVPQDPGSFWCHDLLQTAPMVQEQQKWTPPSLDSLSSYLPEENEICLGFYEKYGEWYRVKILEAEIDCASVFLIDYGEKITIPLTLLLPLPKELSVFPPLAFNCQLSAWESLRVLSPDAPKHFQETVTGKPLLCEILSHDQDSGVRMVILSDLQSELSIASILFKAFERKGF